MNKQRTEIDITIIVVSPCAEEMPNGGGSCVELVSKCSLQIKAMLF